MRPIEYKSGLSCVQVWEFKVLKEEIQPLLLSLILDEAILIPN